jgi:hypothetical protein
LSKHRLPGKNSKTGMPGRQEQDDPANSQEADNTSRADSGVDREQVDQDAHIKHGDQNPFPNAIQDPKDLINPDFVRIYNLALTHRWTKREIYRGVAPVPPVFLYCSLMLPWVLAKVMGATSEKTTTYMVPAILKGFSRVTLKHALLPTLVPNSATMSSDKLLQGFLLGCMKDWALKKIEGYIDMADHEQDVVEVEVETPDGERIIVAAYVYVWNGPLSALEDKSWDPVEYMKSGSEQKSSQLSKSGREVVGLRVGRTK